MQNGVWAGEVQDEGEAGLEGQCVVALLESPAVDAAEGMKAAGEALPDHGVFVHRYLDPLLGGQFLEVSPDAFLVGQQVVGKGGQQDGVVVVEGEQAVHFERVDQAYPLIERFSWIVVHV